jgi:hypothetical protein
MEKIEQFVEQLKVNTPNLEFLFMDTKSDALIDIDVTNTIGEDFSFLADDVTRMLILQIIIQFMLSMRDNKEYPFFSQSFFELLFYIILGLMFYWLVVRKLVRFL